MNDNEIIRKLQDDVFDVLNQSQMPVMVKALIVENALLKLHDALSKEQIETLKNNQEVNLHVDTLNMETGATPSADTEQDE